VTDVLAPPTTLEPSRKMSGELVALVPGWWAAGLNLVERCALSGAPAVASDPDGRAGRRLARWREAHGLAESGQFDRRLAAAGLSEAGLTALLTENPAGLATRAEKPMWAELVEEVMARLPEQRSIPEPGGPESVPWQVGFSSVVSPFTELGYERLLAAASGDGMDELVSLAELRAGFVSALIANLITLASRTLVLELNVLRVTDRLSGDSSHERFWSFVRHFAQRSNLAALLAEYPVLARLLAQATSHAVDSWLELLRRFIADRSTIVAELFGGADPGRLVEVSTGRGDTHQRGRSVAVLRFEEGGRLVYKPRPLAVHVHFNDCLDWLNRIVTDLELRRLAVLDRDDYGWVEFAGHHPCDDRSDLERYYRRQGALLALLYTLDGADFHYENLIASGDQPVLVDLEALFHPVFRPTGPELQTGDPALAAQQASVFRVGLLPSLVFGEDRTVLDFGGNGGDAGAPIPFKAAGWAAAGTDEMRLVREQRAFPGSQNQPRLGEVTVDAGEFAAELLAGFRAGYDAIAVHRADLTGPDGLIRRFAADDLRVVVRATRVYGMLLDESTHPDVLRDALDRDRILDYLWALSDEDPARERLVALEQEELWAGDVPLFATRPGTRDLWTSASGPLPEVFEVAGIESAASKIDVMCPDDREVQEWIIQATFATRQAVMGVREARPDAPAPRRIGPAPVEVAGAVDPERVLAAARLAGDRLAETAYRDRDRVGWLGLHFMGEAQWAVQPLSYDLYSGYPGVALFLSQLAEVTAEQRYAELAYQALAPLRELTDTLGDQPAAGPRCSAFTSSAGMAYGLVHVAANLHAPELLTPVEPLVAAVGQGVGEDEALDVIGGSAGGLVAMLAIHQATGLPVALEIARACADRLVQTAQPRDRGVAWATQTETVHPLTGFSHGAAGMGWALLRYAAVTGEKRYAEVGLDAFRYERSHYRPDIGNWPDFRILTGATAPAADEPPNAMHAWCHGAPGIGLARVDSGFMDHPEVAADVRLAVAGLLAYGPSANLSLCHGQLGNLELLTATGRPERAAWAEHSLAMFERMGPVCGTPGGVSTPGLMAGLAGIGHGLLRLGFPDRVPSVLLLQPPRVRP
jgi:type 2 lantibiotic biosynthesis protein LanM